MKSKKRTVLKVVVWLELAWGVLCLALAALLCVLGLPAFMSTISGTTSLLLVGEGSQVLESSFVIAALGIVLLVQGVLTTIQAVLGRRALKHGDFGKYVFMCGVVACSTLFELLGGIYPNSPTSLAVIVFQAAMAALAWSIHKEAARQQAGKE